MQSEAKADNTSTQQTSSGSDDSNIEKKPEASVESLPAEVDDKAKKEKVLHAKKIVKVRLCLSRLLIIMVVWTTVVFRCGI